MKNISHPDIFIIVTDSARAYNSNSGDDRERPTYYNRLDEFVHCTQAYTSAPSSVMSGAAMISSLDSYALARNYDNFRFNNSFNVNNVEKITEIGYKAQGFFAARELREKIGNLVGLDYENKLSSNNFYDRRWSNGDINKIVDNYLTKNSKSKKPLFNLIWHDMRNDFNISKNLEDLENIIKKHNKWKNSIIFFLSDHGYPSKDKGITPEGLKKDKKTHDLWMTEDNIRIPFFFKTPNDHSYEISQNVSTIDIFPTIFNLIGKSPQIKYSVGVSLSSINQDRESQLLNRFLRVDSRFIGQSQRKTAIIYQNNKLVYEYDDNLISLFELDQNNITIEKEIDDKIKLKKLMKAYDLNEQNSLRFQYSTQLNNVISKYNRFVIGEFDKSLIEYFEYEHLNYSLFNQLSTIEKIKILFFSKVCLINTPTYNKILIKILRIVSKRFIYVSLVSDQEVIKWGIKRIYLAIKNTIPYIFNEPKYVYIRAKEFIK
jgi:hypothetical protein